jgi:hypothetical protein
MALFLNTNKIAFWINEIIKTSQKELILVVPYIKTSSNVLDALLNADHRGVDITLIYRENNLTENEKSKLLSLKNLNLLHHPNIHCKCYYNGEILVIGSMNLYEYSEKNNREMGVLIHRDNITDIDNKIAYSDDNKIFDDTISEIREIINGCSMEKVNPHKRDSSFELDLIKSNEDIEVERCNRINSHFLNKKFKTIKTDTNQWNSRCTNYFDKVDVVFEDNRLAVKINLPEYELNQIYKNWMDVYNEFEFKGFKYYWNSSNQPIYLYKDLNFDWDNLGENQSIYHKKLKEGIDSIINKYRSISKK